jgi:hypothetical protein
MGTKVQSIDRQAGANGDICISVVLLPAAQIPEPCQCLVKCAQNARVREVKQSINAKTKNLQSHTTTTSEKF